MPAGEIEITGEKGQKLWASSQAEPILLDFVKNLDSKTPDQLRMFASRCVIGDAESNAWQRYFYNMELRPYVLYRLDDGRLLRIDLSMKNEVVRNEFKFWIFDEARKGKLRWDQISQLGFLLGGERGGGGESGELAEVKGVKYL